MVQQEPQVTLRGPLLFEGTGLFSGAPSRLQIKPAPVDTGLVFKRVDLKGAPSVPALAEYVSATPRHTRLQKGEAEVWMVEHLLSALHARGIDNAYLDLEGNEIPSLDGSSLSFTTEIDRVGLQVQEKEKKFLILNHPVIVEEGGAFLIALPAPDFRIRYTLQYPFPVGSQYIEFLLSWELYKKEIAPCRTFSLFEEVAPLIEKGMIRGGGLHNSLVFKEGAPLNPEGLRFADEPARHKVLDLIGDLALVGRPLKAQIVSVKSGHAHHVLLAKQLRELQ